MVRSSRALPVSIYFVWEWWEEHFQRILGRPDHIDLDWLDTTYLARQRFLYEQFGAYAIGEAEPALDTAYLARVMPYHTALLPIAMGMKATVKMIGGWNWHPLPEERLRHLQPVDLARSPIGELLLQERERMLARYGVATQFVDFGSPANNAFMLRGSEFYADLLADKDLAQHYLEPITETICLAYRFLCEQFEPIESFPLGNCNVVMMSPAIYIDTIREHDIRCVRYAADLQSKPPLCDLHHCDVKTEPFAEAYAAIPGLRSLQGSYLSDLQRIREVLPQVDFSAMVSPVHLLHRAPADIDRELERCLRDDVRDLAIWNIDVRFGPERVLALLGRIHALAAAHDRKAIFSVMPFSWEEMDWEFPRYRSDFQLGPGLRA